MDLNLFLASSNFFPHKYQLNVVNFQLFGGNLHVDSLPIRHLIQGYKYYLQSLTPKENVLLTRKRHVQGVKKAISSLKQSSLINLTINPELAAEELRIAATEIGNITNIIDVEEILNDIFSSFCIGK